MAWWYPHLVAPIANSYEVELLKDGLNAQLNPEPKERFIFQSLCLITPIFVWGLSALSLRLENFSDVKNWPEKNYFRQAAGVFVIFVATFVFYPFVNSDYVEAILGAYQEYQIPIQFIPLATIGAVLGAFIWMVSTVFYGGGNRWVRVEKKRRLTKAVSWVVFVGSVVLTIFSWRLFGINRVTIDQAWFISMDAAVYALSQVVGGRTILMDIPSQYGMFPEILAPILKLFGASVFNVSAIFAVMQLLSLASLFAVLVRYVKGPGVLMLSGFALVFITFGTSGHSVGNEEVYFQYWPIRFFWPALSVWVFCHFVSSRTLARSGLVSLVAALGCLWNLDTGLAIWLAFPAFLFFRFLGVAMNPVCQLGPSRWMPADYVKAVVLHVVIAVVVGGAFFGYLNIKGNGVINPDWLFRYQLVFYKLGFMMIPLPRYYHPWMVVLGVYLLGLLYAFRRWVQGRPGQRADIVGFISFLGMGLFVYYQGRSHVLNLVAVCWPALMISALLSDEAFRMVRSGKVITIYALLPTVAIAVFLMPAVGFLYKIPSLLREVEAAYRLGDHFVSSVVEDEVSFIAANSQTGQKCLILSKRQGIYYLQTRLVSPLAGPGLMESMMKSDDDELSSAIEAARPACIFLGVGNYSRPALPIPLDRILLNYQVARRSSGANMVYLTPFSRDLP